MNERACSVFREKISLWYSRTFHPKGAQLLLIEMNEAEKKETVYKMTFHAVFASVCVCMCVYFFFSHLRLELRIAMR